MSDSVVRLALIGSADDIGLKCELLQRLRAARLTVTTDSMQEALRDLAEFDAAVVSGFENARCVAEHGKHVFIDAPFADSFQEAETLIETCQRAKVILAVGGLIRHAPACQTIIDRLSRGKLGDPGLLRVHRWRTDNKRTVSSTIFGDIDLAIHLFQATPKEIYAIGRIDHSYIQIHLGFPNGGMALLDFAQRMPTGQVYNSLSLIGSKGAAYADDHQNTHLLFTGGNPAALISDAGTGGLVELREFVNCIAHGVSPTIDGQTILTVHRVTDAIRHSIESKQVLHQRGGVYEPA